MTNPAHLLLTGLVLLVAFLAGAIIGSILKVIALALTRPRIKPARRVASSRATPARGKRKRAAEVDAAVLAAMEKAMSAPPRVELSIEDVLASAAGERKTDSAERIEPMLELPTEETATEPAPGDELSVAAIMAATEPEVAGEQDFAQAMLALTMPEPVTEPGAVESASPVEDVVLVEVSADVVEASIAETPVAAPIALALLPTPPVAEPVGIANVESRLSPARVAGRSVSGRDIADPRRGAPPRPMPKPSARPFSPSARVIPFPVQPAVTTAPTVVLRDVKAELEALLDQTSKPEVSAFSRLPEPSISPRLQAARAELELVSSIPVAPARPPVVLTTEAFGSSASKSASGPANAEALQNERVSNLPLGLESTLAEAIGATMELAPSVGGQVPSPRRPKAEASPVALAAFDIAADVPHEAESFEDIDIVPEFELVGFDISAPKTQQPVAEPVAAPPVEHKDVVPVTLDVDVGPELLDAGDPTADDAMAPIGLEVVDLEQMRAALAGEVVVPDSVELPTISIDSDQFVAGMEHALMGPPAPVAEVDSDDEAAAMHAIEGTWSPRRAPPRLVRSAELPDGGDASSALAASGAAVASATRTANAIMSDMAPDPGRPSPLDGPRDGVADDLTHIIGVLPVIETALNKLGVYHYDQIAGWSGETVAWVEKHLGLDGRIQRELWRLQARELAAARPTLRKAKI